VKKLIIVAVLVFVGVAGYQINQSMSHDAVVLVIGFMFGVLAGLPAALIVVASQRRHESDHVLPMPHYPQLQQQQQPPIIVLDSHRQRQDISATGGGTYQMMTPRNGRFNEL